MIPLRLNEEARQGFSTITAVFRSVRAIVHTLDASPMLPNLGDEAAGNLAQALERQQPLAHAGLIGYHNG